MERILLRTVSRRWSNLMYDRTLLEQISLSRNYSEDRKLSSLFAATKKLVAVDLLNCRFLDGSCVLLGGLSRLRRLNLSGTRVTDGILQSILKASKELEELHLVDTEISESCIPEIVALKKLHYIGFPPEGVSGFGRNGVLSVVKACPTLRVLDCQEGYFFTHEDIMEIMRNNCLFSTLLIPYAFVDNSTFAVIVDSLQSLTYICVCETNVSQECVDQIKNRRPRLNICWNVNHTP